MAKKISSSDLFTKEDIFEGIRLSAQKTIEQLNKLDAEFKELANAMQSTLKGATTNTTSGLNTFVQTTQKANSLMEQSIQVVKLKAQAEQQLQKAQQEAEKTAQQKQKTEQAELRTKQQQQKETERLAKAQEKATRTAQNEASAYKKLEKNTRDLKNESKRLGAEMLALERAGKKNSSAYKELESRYKSVTASAQRGDAQLKKLDKSVGDNFRNVGNYEKALGRLQGMLGQLGIAFGISTIVRSSFNAIKDFDQGMANLASVLGTTKDKINALSDDAKRLGATTRFTAGEVAQLQTEFAKLGFNEQEILDATESTLSLAGATGTDLARASSVAGSTLRAFGLDAKEMQRVNDVMAKSFSTSALDMDSFAEAMKYVAPVSKAAGVSIEETTAMIGALADNGIKGSQAGTGLRRIFSEMAKTGKPVQEALAEISAKGLTLTDAMDEVGRSAQTALLVLSENQEKVGKLTTTFENAEGSAQAMADTQLNTLGGALDLLKSAWEGYILALNESSGAGNGLVKSIKFLAENLDTILNLLGTALRVYVSFRVATMGQVLANNLLSGSFVKVAQRVGIMKASLMGLSRGFKALKTAIASNPLGILVTIATEIYANWDKVQEIFTGVKTQTEEMKEAMREYNAEIEGTAEYTAEMNKYVGEETGAFVGLIEQLRNTTYESAERQKLIDQINSTYGTTLKNIKDETKFTGQLNTAVANYIALKEQEFKIKKNEEAITKVLERKVNATGKLSKAQQKLRAEEERLAGIQANQRGTFDPVLVEQYAKDIANAKANIVQYGEEVALAGSNVSALDSRLNQLGGGILDTKARISQLTAGYGDMDDEMENVGGTTDKNKDKQKDINTEFKKTNDYLSKQEELLNKVADIEKKRAIGDLEQSIQSEVDLQKSKVAETGEYDLNQFTRLVDEKYQLEVNRILDQATFEQGENEKKYALEKQARMDALADEYRDLKKGAEGNATEIAKIDKNYATAKEKLTEQEKLIYADLVNENKILSKEATDEAEALEKSRIDFTKSTNDDLLNAQKEYLKSKEELDKEGNEKDLEAIKKIEEEKRAIITATADIMTKQSEARISQMDTEIAKAEEQLEHYKQMAQEGNITAQESLAEQQRIIDEANLKKEREQKRQQRIKLAESIYSTYSAKVESGSANPLAETIRDTTLLQQFIASLPTFLDGTEDTGLNGRGIDGKGGFHAVLHPNERVIPKNLNEKIGTLSNTELAKVAHEYQNGRMMEGATQSASALEFSLLVSEIKDLKQVIKDKPETSIGLGEITQSMVEIVEKRVRGNSVTFNRFKVRK